MKKAFTTLQVAAILLLLFISTNLQAQNLIPNYGFELQDSCPLVSEIFVAPPWNSPTFGTPDIFNSTCPIQNTPGHTGIGSSGVFVFSGTFPNNREYIQAPLISPLVGGQVYCVSFWVKRANFRYATNRIGAYFSPSQINMTSTTSVLPYSPQIDNPENNLLSSSTWMQVSGSFTATGGESFIIIGSFASDALTDTVAVNSSSTSKVAYYYIDDISLATCITGIGDPAKNDINVFPTPAKDFLNIQIPASITVQTIRLVNVRGQEIKNMVINQIGGGDFVLNVEDVQAGIYVLFLEMMEGTVSKKVLVVK